MLKLSEEEINRESNQILEQLNVKELREFYEHRQDDVMEEVYEYIKNGCNAIDNRSILCQPEDYPITPKEFFFLTINLKSSFQKDDWFVDVDNILPNQSMFFKYKEIIVELLYTYGPQTIFTIRKAKNL